MNIFTELKNDIITTYQELYGDKILASNVGIEIPKDPLNGDLSTNIAMIIAAQQKEKPKEVAFKFKEQLSKLPYIAHIEVAGPGFINFTIKASQWQECIKNIVSNKEYFAPLSIGNSEKINIEYVSANPTGPMHVGHIRCAVYGEVLANILIKCGYDVVKEYYINDAGTQIQNLANSAFLRYKQALTNEKIEITDWLYSGEYLIDVGRKLANIYKDKLLDMEESERSKIIKEFSVKEMMKLIKQDLSDLGIKHDIFTSEQELIDKGKIDQVVERLNKEGKIYSGVLPPPKGKIDHDWTETEQLLFKSTAFGDDQDRTIKKFDDSWTYFAGDLALTEEKISHNYSYLIYIVGADHIGYIKRINAVVNALSNGKVKSTFKTCNIVKLIKNGELVKMSKRQGVFVTAKQIIEDVGKDNIRFMMLSRHNDMELDFDFEKVKSNSKNNPVYYVQYAHVRTISIINNAKNNLPQAYEQFSNNEFDLTYLNSEEEIQLIKSLSSWPKILESAAKTFEPHRLAFYLLDVAAKFHSIWNLGKENNDYRFIIENNIPLTISRLVLTKAVQNILANGLNIIGIAPINEM